MKPDRVIVGILACARLSARRRAVEATWLPALRATGARPYFLVGRPGQPTEAHGETLFIDCEDTYGALCHKMLGFLRYARAHLDFDFIFKCDDDTFVDVTEWSRIPYEGFDFTTGRLLTWKPGNGSWMRSKGLGRRPEHREFLSMVGAFPVGGEGYVLSRRAVDEVLLRATAELVDRAPPCEDVLVTGLLKMSGIEPNVVGWLARRPNDVLKRLTVERRTRFATVHPVDPLGMRTLHWRHRPGVGALHAAVQLKRVLTRWPPIGMRRLARVVRCRMSWSARPDTPNP